MIFPLDLFIFRALSAKFFAIFSALTWIPHGFLISEAHGRIHAHIATHKSYTEKDKGSFGGLWTAFRMLLTCVAQSPSYFAPLAPYSTPSKASSLFSWALCVLLLPITSAAVQCVSVRVREDRNVKRTTYECLFFVSLEGDFV